MCSAAGGAVGTLGEWSASVAATSPEREICWIEAFISSTAEASSSPGSTFSAGTGFPFGQKMGSLDLGVSYSMIGSLADNGLESRIWRLTVSVTGLERWW